MATNKELEKLVKELAGSVLELKTTVENLTKVEVKPVVVEATPDKVLDELLDGPSSPISQEYREVVDQVLNRSFGIHTRPASTEEQAGFKFAIIVPPRYSKLNQNQKEMNKFDIRLRFIDSAEGVNGVRAWTDTVFNNFDPTIQAQIAADRLVGVASQ